MSDTTTVLRLPHLDGDGDKWLTLAEVKRRLGIAHRTQAVRLLDSGALRTQWVMIPPWTQPRRCVRSSEVAAYAAAYGIEMRGST